MGMTAFGDSLKPVIGGTPSQRILSLWDNGLSAEAIAARLGKPKKKITETLATYDGTADFRRHRDAMRAGSAALLAAIQQVRA